MSRLRSWGIASVSVLLLSACAQQVATPEIDTVSMVGKTVAAVPVASQVVPAAYPNDLPLLPLPPERQTLFQAGDTNALVLTVDAPLAEAYRAYFSGEGTAALSALSQARTESPLKRFHLSAQKVRTLIMMGRAAEAEAETTTMGRLERAVLGSDLNALALRAEARLWLGDYAAAESDALTVAAALQNWVLPHSFGGPPTNMAEIVLLTTAQLRAYTVLAGLHVLQGDGAKAMPWAEAAELGYNTVHTVAADSLYGIFFKSYPESYYGRAFNMLFRGTARALNSGNYADGATDFESARRYFDAIGYKAGAVSAAALESWTLYALDQDRNRALAIAEAAVQLAGDSGFPDFIWRISALRGEMLIDQGRMEEAEIAFRRADASVDLVTGALSTDRAKLRYGVGKETIARRLVRFDVLAGDLTRLFTDLERARARAFVDMLADRPVATGRSGELVTRIRALDDAIRQGRVRLMAPRAEAAEMKEKIDRLIADRRMAVGRLRQIDPDLADVHAARTAGLNDVRGRLGQNDVLIYTLPIDADTAVRFLAVDASGARIVSTDMSGADLHRSIVQFREAVRLGRAPAQRRLAGQIQQRLLSNRWRTADRLYVVPSGDLFFVPWGALPDIGRVVILPTGGWLLRKGGGVSSDRVGLVGDPQFGGALPQLAGARQEVLDLAGLFQTVPLVGNAATVEALRRRIGEGASVLHLATHGTFNAKAPLHSTLYLSDGEGPAPLTAADLFERPIPAALVVLSACETGMGEAVAGDDFLGLTRSFYLGGATTVVNSLWPISDEGTRLFMSVFHSENLRTGDPAEAWLAARTHLRDEGFPPSVYGAFVVGGAVN